MEFVRRLRAAFPHSAIFVSTSTLAGRATAGDKLGDLATGVFFAPLDYAFAVRRVLRALQPAMLIAAETEIWPNVFREATRTGAGLAIVNGRISDRAFARYRPLCWFFRAVLGHADSVLAQTADIRERFVAIGAPAERVCVTGNFKYDFDPRPAPAGSPVVEFVRNLQASKVWIAASTMPPAAAGDPDEDDAVLAAYADLVESHRDLLLILAPRKPERFDVVARKLEGASICFTRRSRLDSPASMALPHVLLLDTIGELGGLFGLADVVFMGGTLAQRGGHNILEPALFGKPVLVGPHMENFQAIADEFRAENACVGISDASELAAAVGRILDEPATGDSIGRRALACAEANRGATARAVHEVQQLYGVPSYRPAQPWFAIRWALSRVWRWGGQRRQQKQLMAQRRIDAPVVSIGNLTMGGTGKTPCVLHLTEILKQCGRTPGILTRGYGRGSPEKHLVLPPRANIRAEHSGDEPLIFVRSGLAPVGIGADRYRAGMDLRDQFGVDVLLLDDGFQHRQLFRDVDIVLIDALNPFGGGDVFPLGRLREPVEALSRAAMIVITRSEFSDLGPSIERTVRRWNPDAPIFHATVQPRAWVAFNSGREYPISEPPFDRIGMFCGLGNPQSFVRTLEHLGIAPVDWVGFADHHRYRPEELRRISHQFAAEGASALVTTEKDSVNLCEHWDDLLKPLPLYWLKIGMSIDRESEFLERIAVGC
jgi:3-deoxy-D-manno-octulosonic-acid transferase